MTPAEAAALVMAAAGRDPAAARAADRASKAVKNGRILPSSPEGFEVVIPRRIARSEILRVKPLPQVVGWRHRPGAHGAPPCACICCERGRYGIRRLLARVEAEEAGGRIPKLALFGRDEASYRRVVRLAQARGKRGDRR
jgi:hypothetical protein